jgi:hypothetical protein
VSVVARAAGYLACVQQAAAGVCKSYADTATACAAVEQGNTQLRTPQCFATPAEQQWTNIATLFCES